MPQQRGRAADTTGRVCVASLEAQLLPVDEERAVPTVEVGNSRDRRRRDSGRRRLRREEREEQHERQTARHRRATTIAVAAGTSQQLAAEFS